MPGRKATESERREQILSAAHERGAAAGGRRPHGGAVAAEAGSAMASSCSISSEGSVGECACWIGCSRPPCRCAVGQRDRRLIRTPRERLRALLRQEVDRLTRDTRQLRLFLEYWALGTRHGGIQAKISVGPSGLSGGLPEPDG